MSKTETSKISRKIPITAPLVGAATAEPLMPVALSLVKKRRSSMHVSIQYVYGYILPAEVVAEVFVLTPIPSVLTAATLIS